MAEQDPPRRDPEQLSDALEREADVLDRDAREVQGRIDEAREDWHRKRADEGVPGAPPPEDDDSEDSDHEEDDDSEDSDRDDGDDSEDSDREDDDSEDSDRESEG